MTTFPLRKIVNDEQWEAEEDLAGRLGILAHAAFLRAGFVPYGDEPSSGHLLKQADEIGPSAPCLSRRYTAPQLGKGAVAATDVVVLKLRARGNGDVAFQAYLLLRSDGGRRLLSCEAVLDEATLAPLLCCPLADAARALETGSPGAWLWKSLADWVAPALLLELCRRNDLPVTGFASLPDDAKAEILKRLTDGKDLARVECTSKQLQRLVAERDGELWKAIYESLGRRRMAQISESDSEAEGSCMGSWKERYMKARRRPTLLHRLFANLFDYYRELEEWSAQRRRQREADLELRREWEADLQRLWVPRPRVNIVINEPVRFTGFEPTHYPPPAPAPEREVAARGKNAGRQHCRVPRRNEYHKKRHGAGAIHSPSSRYKWKHR